MILLRNEFDKLVKELTRKFQEATFRRGQLYIFIIGS